MSWFSSAFKAIGSGLKSVATFVKPIAQAGLSALPIVGPMASAVVGKLLPDAPVEVQQQATEAVAQIAANPVSVNMPPPAQLASELKQTLIASGVPAAQASAVGAVAHGVSQVPPAQAAAVLQSVTAALPEAALQNNLTKEDVKTVVNGAVKNAKEGAVNAYLDETEEGRQVKREAVEAQGSKVMPWLFAIGLGLVLWKSKKR